MSALDRRRFVELALGAAVSCAGLGCASMVTYRVTPENGRVRLNPRDHPGLGGPGGFLRVQPDGFAEPMYVLALQDGTYAAVSPICTHRGCTVDVAGATLVCPCHGSVYDREGGVLQGPAERALTRFPVRTDDEGFLVVQVGQG